MRARGVVGLVSRAVAFPLLLGHVPARRLAGELAVVVDVEAPDLQQPAGHRQVARDAAAEHLLAGWDIAEIDRIADGIADRFTRRQIPQPRSAVECSE